MHDSLPVWCIHESYWKYVPWNQRKQYVYTKNVPQSSPIKKVFNQNICWQLVSADSKVEKKISVIVVFCFVYKSRICKLAQNGDSLSVLHFKCDFKHCRYIYTHTYPEYTYISTNHAHHLFRTEKRMHASTTLNGRQMASTDQQK